jgi:hypothetical protein
MTAAASPRATRPTRADHVTELLPLTVLDGP